MSYEKYDLVKLTNSIPLVVQHEISILGMDIDGLFHVIEDSYLSGEVILLQTVNNENRRIRVRKEYTVFISKRFSKGDLVKLVEGIPVDLQRNLQRNLTVDGVDPSGMFWVVDTSNLNSVAVDQPVGEGVRRVVFIPAEYLQFIRKGLVEGDKVWLKPGAHSSEDSYVFSTPENVLEELNHKGVEYNSTFIVDETADVWGDVCLVPEGDYAGYVYVKDQFISTEPPSVREGMPLVSVVKGGMMYPSEDHYDFETAGTGVLFSRIRRANEWIGIESGKLDSLLKLAGELK